jgi:hypothetical protein
VKKSAKVRQPSLAGEELFAKGLLRNVLPPQQLINMLDYWGGETRATSLGTNDILYRRNHNTAESMSRNTDYLVKFKTRGGET